jgi:hypothetical protein
MPPEITDLNDYQIPEWPTTPEGEARQAEEIVRHYRLLIGHPAVQSVNYWGITDDGAWLGAPAGLIRRDGTPKPSYGALAALIKGEWWRPPTEARTDANGVVPVRGFYGDYVVSAGDGEARFTVDRIHPTVTVALSG